MFSFDEITKVDPEIAAAMTDELNRQNNNLELIASENIVSTRRAHLFMGWSVPR